MMKQRKDASRNMPQTVGSVPFVWVASFPASKVSHPFTIVVRKVFPEGGTIRLAAM